MTSQHSSTPSLLRPRGELVLLWPEPRSVAPEHIVWLADLPEPLQAGLAILGCDPASSAQEALILASASGSLSCVEGLASFLGSSADFPLALAKAANGGHLDCCEALIPLAPERSALDVAARRACVKNHADCLRAILASPLFSSEDPCESSILIAAAQGSPDCLALLLPRSTPEALAKAVTQASHFGHAACLELLLPHATTDRLDLALIHSAKNGHIACVETLLPCVEWQAKGRAMSSAIRNGRFAVLCSIVDGEAESSQLPLRSALFTAASLGQLECLTFLASKTNPNAQGLKALREASSSGHVACASFLAPLADDALSTLMQSDTLPFPPFLGRGHLPHAAASGASLSLCSAADSGQIECVALFSPQCDVAQNTQALIIASENGHLACVELLAPSADLAFGHWRALQAAAEGGRGALLDFFLPLLASDPQAPALESFPKICRDNGMSRAALFFEALVDQSALEKASSLGPRAPSESTRQRL